jgi:hypothetical protein
MKPNAVSNINNLVPLALTVFTAILFLVILLVLPPVLDEIVDPLSTLL